MRFVLLLLLAGCSHASIDASSNTSSSGTATGARVGLHVESRSLAAVVIAGMFIAAAAEEAGDPRPFPSFATFSDWFRGRAPAELDPSRPVSEQDCSRPVELGANLRCR